MQTAKMQINLCHTAVGLATSCLNSDGAGRTAQIASTYAIDVINLSYEVTNIF